MMVGGERWEEEEGGEKISCNMIISLCRVLRRAGNTHPEQRHDSVRFPATEVPAYSGGADQ